MLSLYLYFGLQNFKNISTYDREIMLPSKIVSGVCFGGLDAGADWSTHSETVYFIRSDIPEQSADATSVAHN